jgi:hypothetical protein
MKSELAMALLFCALPGWSAAADLPKSLEQVIAAVNTEYSGELKARNLTLQFSFQSEDSSLDAWTTRKGNVATIFITEGLMSFSTLTRDGLALLVCHEVGHYFGGFPYRDVDFSVEGQADLYATGVCLKRVLGELEINFPSPRDVPKEFRRKCHKRYQQKENRGICEQSLLAAYQIYGIFQLTANHPRNEEAAFASERGNGETSDYLLGYPSLRCRLKTWLMGIFENTESEALDRPSCWYRDQ